MGSRVPCPSHMGAAKAWQEEQWARGYRWVADKYVCPQCVDDLALRELIAAHAEETSCSYCESTDDQPIACELDLFLGWVAEAIALDWDDATNFMPYEGDGWALPGVNREIYDLLGDGELELDVHPALFDDIVQAFIDRTFAPRHYFGLGPDERLHYGWESFVRQVTHWTRYLFMQVPAIGVEYAGPEELAPNQMLTELGKLIDDGQLVHELEAGQSLFRVRLHERATKERPASGRSLGTPPVEHARISNRMSPNGIPMFYGAFDSETAVVETIAPGWPDGDDLTVAEFVNQRPLRVVDLTHLPAVPSLYDQAKRTERPWIAFLHRFAKEVSEPINRDEREHLEYVPTQIVTEYFRHVFSVEHEPIHGIIYRSSVREGGRCIVLFIENDNCGGDDEPDMALALTSAFSLVPHIGTRS
jgi:hypothetical protein